MNTQTETSFRHWQIGQVRVTKIVESESLFDIPTMFPKASAEEVQRLGWLKPHFVTDDWQGKLSIHALVVETPDLTVVVDTCIGNDRDRQPFETSNNLQTAFLEDFAAAAFSEVSLDWRDHVESRSEFFRPSDLSESRANPAKAAAKLGWRAKSGVKEVVKRMMADEV